MGEVKLPCTLRHRSLQLILVYSWARSSIFAAGKCFISSVSSLLFIFHFLPCLSLASLLSLLCPFSLSLGDDTKWHTRVDMSLTPNTKNTNVCFVYSLESPHRVVVNLGTQERVRLSHVKHATCVRAIEVSLCIHVIILFGFYGLSRWFHYRDDH